MNEIIGQDLLGRYQVIEFIGQGGMAQVYKVWDSQRTVYLAMKLLREEIALDRVFLRRFKREALTLAKLQHPNVVRFYALEQEGELAFMLMDYVEGKSLKHEIFTRGSPFPSERILQIMRPVCSALHYAHNQGMVHCDVKPANMMIHRNGTILLTDFGIARVTEAATTTTLAGAGTPAYMAPEQIRGEDPLPQTDIYSLGIVLYEMVTGGERPFTGERAQSTGTTAEKVRWEQVHLEPPSPRSYNRGLSPDMEQIILTCLAKEPGQRYGSAIDLLNAVEATVAEASPTPPVSAPGPAVKPPPVPPIQPPRAVRRPRGRIPVWGAIGGGVLVVTLALAGLVFSGAFGRPMPTATPTARASNTPTDTPSATATSTSTIIATAISTPTYTPTATQAVTLAPLTPVSTAVPPTKTNSCGTGVYCASIGVSPVCPNGSDAGGCCYPDKSVYVCLLNLGSWPANNCDSCIQSCVQRGFGAVVGGCAATPPSCICGLVKGY